MKAILLAVGLVLALSGCGEATRPGDGMIETVPAPPVARDVATASSGGRTARVELRLQPSVVRPGESPTATLTNTGKVPLVHGVPFKLERKTASGWRWINRQQAFILPLLTLRPGETSDPQPIEVYGDEPAPVRLKPGLYRVTKTVGLESSYANGAELRVRATFRVL